MGFLDKLKAASSGLPSDFIEKYRTVDLELEENEDLISTIEHRAKSPVNEASLNYSIFKNFIINIANEEIADFILPKNDTLLVAGFGKLLDAWKAHEAIKKDNVFRVAMNNKSFKNLARNGKFDVYDYGDFYNGYSNDIYGLDEAKDEESVIFNRDLWIGKDDSEITRYIEIDNQLKNDPEKRKKILYKEDGKELRLLKFIEQDLEK